MTTIDRLMVGEATRTTVEEIRSKLIEIENCASPAEALAAVNFLRDLLALRAGDLERIAA
jgi:hypothetical protein